MTNIPLDNLVIGVGVATVLSITIILCLVMTILLSRINETNTNFDIFAQDFNQLLTELLDRQKVLEDKYRTKFPLEGSVNQEGLDIMGTVAGVRSAKEARREKGRK